MKTINAILCSLVRNFRAIPLLLLAVVGLSAPSLRADTVQFSTELSGNGIRAGWTGSGFGYCANFYTTVAGRIGGLVNSYACSSGASSSTFQIVWAGDANGSAKPAGGAYAVYNFCQAHETLKGATGLTVNIAYSNCGGNAASTTTFQHSGADDAWRRIGDLWLDGAMTAPTIKFTWASGGLSSSARWYSEQFKLIQVAGLYAVHIDSGPSGTTTLCVGSSYGPLTVNAGTTTGPTYQWRKNASAISGATGSSYTDSSASTGDAGTYDCVVSGTYGGPATSSSAVLVVNSPPTTASAGGDQNVCGSLVATMAGNTPGVGSGSWSKVSGSGTVTFGSASSPTSTATASVYGTYVLRWTISNGVCTASTDDMTVNYYATPTTANAGTDQTQCETSTATLAGNTPTVGTGTWTRTGGSGTITTPSSPTSGVTGLGYGANTFKWTIHNGTCSDSTDSVIITRYQNPTTANAGGDQSVYGLVATLAGNTPTVGSGRWSKVSGPGNVTFGSASSSSSTATVDAYGTNVFRWTITNGLCAASSDDVQITYAPTNAAALEWAVGSGIWDINTTANWKSGTGASTPYQETTLPGDAVIFEDTQSGASPIIVTLNTNVHPKSVTATNSSKTYTIAGSGSIAGNVALAKQGSGTLTLANANSYSGGTTLTAGQLNINSPQALGSVAGSFTISGGTIDNTSSGALTTLDYPQAWNGNFTFAGTEDLNLGAGDVTLSASRTVTVNGGNLTIGGAVSGAGFGLTKAGAGVLTLNNSADAYTGVTTVSAGTLRMGDDYVIPGASQVVLAGGATLDMSAHYGIIAALSGPGSVINNSSILAVTGDLTTGSTYQNYSCVYGSITNGAIVKDGTHAMALRQTGSLTIPVTFYSKSSGAGTLSVGGSPNQLRTTDALYIPGGALFQLDANDQTVAGLSDDGSGLARINLGGGTLTINEPGFNSFSGVIENSELAGSSTALGQGLRGYYYDHLDFTTLVAVRDDATVNFTDLTSASQLPAGLYPNTNQFSVRWLGQVLSTVAGSYTFTTTCDDGSRLWVNGQLLVDNWVPQSAAPRSGSITLAPNTRYDLVLEYFNNTGAASALLCWTVPGDTATNVIPSANLFLPGPGKLVKTGAGTTVLGGLNTYSGGTMISGGTLALSGSISSTPQISIASGAAFDVSALASGFTFSGASSVQTLAGSSASGTATITAGTGARKLTLNSGALLSFQAAGGASTTVGKISVTGDLTLNANAVSVNVAGSALAAGSYRLLDCTGTLANTGSFGTPAITGAALSSGYAVSISVTSGSAGHVDLVVKATPAFSGLTASPSSTYGASSVSLSGTVSSTGGPTTVYAANGDTVTATINTHAVNGTVSGGSGGFTIIYNDASLKTNGVASSPYTITYAYGGNSTNLNAAANNTTTSLTVNKAALTVTPNAVSRTYDGTTLNGATYSDNTASYSISGFKNSETVASAGVTLSGSMAFNGSTSTTVKNVGTYTLAVGTLGLAANNYSMSFVNPVPNYYVINQANLTVTAASNSKTYDGTTSATAAATITAGSIQTGDSAPVWTETYDTRAVGTGKTLTPAGVVSDGNGGANYHVTLTPVTTGVISQANLTVTAAANNKTYDGTTTATATPTITAGSIQNGDSAPAWTETYDTRNVGTGKTLMPVGVVSDGNNGANYHVTLTPVATGEIDQANLTVTATANTKIYDGSTTATATPTITAGSIQSGDSAPAWTETYDTRNVGTGKTLTPVGVVSDGNSGANYHVTLTPVATGEIDQANLTVTATANTKIYDGSTTATATPTITAGSIQSGDSAPAWTETYDTRNVGTGKTLTPVGVVSDGNSGANYHVTLIPVATGEIDQANLTVTAAANSKTYDGSTSATATPTITAGSIQSDDTAPAWAETYDTRAVGTGKILTPAGVVSDGNSGANYNVTLTPVATGVISQAELTVTAAANTRTYDGSTTATAMPTITAGSIQSGDSAPAWTETYDTRNAGTGKTLMPAGVVSDGNSGSNYHVTLTPVVTGEIDQANLTVTAADNTKTYDGTTSATATPTITAGSIQTGDSAPAWTETYDSRNAGTGKTLTPAGVVSDGNGGANYNVTLTAVTTGVINALASSTVLHSDVNPSGPGSNVTFTATVGAGVGTPEGDVVFLASGVAFSTNTLLSGVATASTTSLPLGTNAIAAQYAAQGNYLGSTDSLDQVVNNSVPGNLTNAIVGIAGNPDGSYTLTFQGTPEAQYCVVASPDVTADMNAWTPLPDSTNTAPSPTGQWSFIVSNAAPQYYRSKAVTP